MAAQEWIWCAFIFAFGCCIGSFLNVVIYRLPRDKSLVSPVSACPGCGNPIRFYEYALSSSLMIVLIGQLVGIWDLGSIILMFFLNATMNLFGIMMEYHNQYTQKTNWLSFVYGSVAGIVPWVVIMIYFLSALNSSGAKPPAFVYAIIPTIFVFFNSFAVNMILQYKKVGKWKDYLVGERAYLILSLAAKTALAWMIFAGTLAPV